MQQGSYVRNKEARNLSSVSFPSHHLCKIVGVFGIDGGEFLSTRDVKCFSYEIETKIARLTLEDTKKIFIKLKHLDLKKVEIIYFEHSPGRESQLGYLVETYIVYDFQNLNYISILNYQEHV